ncbi:MAG: hypothetical protein KAI97_00175 [Gemmatimonadetes bacterium]|nr:hypothetical protein [Gemmatimonadota bacterium]
MRATFIFLATAAYVLSISTLLAMTFSLPSGASAELGPITVIGVETPPTVIDGDEIRLRLEMS